MRSFMNSIAGALSRRVSSLAIGAAMLTLVPLLAQGADLVYVKWEGLSMVVGKTVLLAMPGGPVITGKGMRVESDALVVNVTKTTDQTACPKGPVRVPRATLRTVKMQTKGRVGRVLATGGGMLAGVMTGLAAAVAIDWNGNHDSVARALPLAIGAGGAVAGYLIGHPADKRWTTIAILP